MLSNNKNNVKRILLTGGGSGGSVAPLLAVAEELKTSPQPSPSKGGGENNHPAPLYQGGDNKIPLTPFVKGGKIFEFLWLGTKFGPEQEMVEQAGIKFKAISGGKWRRYFSFKNLTDIFKIKLGFWQAFFIMLKWRPDLVISAGSFISVPVVWAAWLLRAPVLIHQQDIRAGLANKLMALFAKVVTVTFEKSLADYGKKAVWTGNPTRRSLEIPNPKSQIPNINKNLPIVLIVGGGTGAMAINKLVAGSLNELTKFCQIIHITGKNKKINVILEPKAIESCGLLLEQQDPIGRYAPSRMTNYDTYNTFEFLDIEQMSEALNAADLVVTRAGMGILSELSSLGKPSIIIPMPDSHQQENARIFKEKRAAIVLAQENLTSKDFIYNIKKLLFNDNLKSKFKLNIKSAMKKDANKNIVGLIYKII